MSCVSSSSSSPYDLQDTEEKVIVQVIFEVFFLAITLIFNLWTIYVTYTTCNKCIISQLFSASYLGNIMAACSLFGGDLYTLSRYHSIHECTDTVDMHYFLFMGLIVNMIILCINTYFRSRNIQSLSPRSPRDFLVKMVLPIWLGSGILATAVLFIQKGLKGNFTETTLIVLAPFLLILIGLNVHLSNFLHTRQKQQEKLSGTDFNTELPRASQNNILKAKSVVKRIIYCQVVYFFIWLFLVVLMNFFQENRDVSLFCLYVARIVYLGVFVCESKVTMVTQREKCKKSLMIFLKKFHCLNKADGANNDYSSKWANNEISKTTEEIQIDIQSK